MIGKVINVGEFELKFGNKQRQINAYACFKEKKYNTTIIVFSFVGDNNIYYGNAHVKNNKIVIMKLNQDKSELINTFIDNLLNNSINDYKIIKLDTIETVEIISYNNLEIDNNKIKSLDDKTIPKPEIKNEEEKVSNHKLVIFIVLGLILLGVGSYIFVNRENIFNNKKDYECVTSYDHDELDVKVTEIRSINFVNKKINIMDIEVDYLFNNRSDYLSFKRNKKEFNYSLYKDGSYKYLDEEDTLKMFYTNYKDNNLKNNKLDNVIKDLESKGYKCNLIEKE